jgi:hypothetical protein
MGAKSREKTQKARQQTRDRRFQNRQTFTATRMTAI